MNSANVNIKLENYNILNETDEFSNNINMEDLRLILKQATTEIESGTKVKNAYEALDEIELEVFGELLRNRS